MTISVVSKPAVVSRKFPQPRRVSHILNKMRSGLREWPLRSGHEALSPSAQNVKDHGIQQVMSHLSNMRGIGNKQLSPCPSPGPLDTCFENPPHNS